MTKAWGAIAGAALLAASAGAQTGAAGDGVRRMAAADTAAAVATKTNGLIVAALPVDPSINAIVVGRDRSGQVEIHDHLTDVLVDEEGQGTLLVGGRATGQAPTAPGEWRGGTISGGREIPFMPGDVISVPAGVPHQLLLKGGGTIRYLAFKFPKAGGR